MYRGDALGLMPSGLDIPALGAYVPNKRHPFVSAGPALLAVSHGQRMINFAPVGSRIGAPVGTPTTPDFRPRMGLSMRTDGAANGYNTFAGMPAGTYTAVTMATIASVDALGVQQVFMQTSPSVSNGYSLLLTAANVLGLFHNGSSHASSPTLIPTAGVPYFFGATFSEASDIVYYVMRNLLTGQLKVSSAADAGIGTAGSGTWRIGAGGSTGTAFAGYQKFAAAGFFPMPLQALIDWSADPWGVFEQPLFHVGAGVSGVLGGAIGIASETDAALPIGRRKSLTVGIAAESDTAIAIGRRKSRSVGIATETDAAILFGHRKARALGIASETDSAIAIGRRKSKPAGIATEASLALPLGRLKSRLLGTALEVDAALAFGIAHTVAPLFVDPRYTIRLKPRVRATRLRPRVRTIKPRRRS